MADVIAKVTVAHNVVEGNEDIVNTYMTEDIVDSLVLRMIVGIVDILVLRMIGGIVDNVFVAHVVAVVSIRQSNPLYFSFFHKFALCSDFDTYLFLLV